MQIFCRFLPAAGPLFLQSSPPICKTGRNLLYYFRDQVVHLLNCSAWVVFKFALDRQPAGTEFFSRIALE
ncbi:MAG TPA: hypothetical protein VJ785_15930 [Anaerolineales bacterium]|nr:hypothetical protein [Anaerolineales bacterium]